ncbi:phage integrase family site specific recombinase, partial [mine drainage metagenome]
MSSEVSKSLTNPPATRSAPTPARSSRALTAPEFHELAQVPPATEWFANIDNPNTRRAYRNDLEEFMTFVGISTPDELR